MLTIKTLSALNIDFLHVFPSVFGDDAIEVVAIQVLFVFYGICFASMLYLFSLFFHPFSFSFSPIVLLDNKLQSMTTVMLNMIRLTFIPWIHDKFLWWILLLQDLCRQRMQTKSNEQTETLNPDPENAAVTASTGSGARPKTTSGSHPLPGSSSSAVRSSSSMKKKQQSHSMSSDSGGSTVGASGRSSTSSWWVMLLVVREISFFSHNQLLPLIYSSGAKNLFRPLWTSRLDIWFWWVY